MSDIPVLKRIAIVDGPFEFDLGFEVTNGFLVENSCAMYIFDDELRIVKVRKHSGRSTLYITDANFAGITISKDVERGEAVILEMYTKLRSITALDFLTENGMQHARGDAEYNIPIHYPLIPPEE